MYIFGPEAISMFAIILAYLGSHYAAESVWEGDPI